MNGHRFRWLEPSDEERQAEADAAASLVHGNLHAADRWQPWLRGPGARRAVVALQARLARNQRDREERALGYRDLGGDS